jgi:hypothetical protein
MVKALAKCAGITGPRARQLAEQLRAVVDIPWDAALDVFSNHDVPRYLEMCRAHLPGFDAMDPDCKGVILSVVFNRGPSFDAAGPRYSEMREIKKCIKSGDLAKIPALLRSMERLWPNSRGLRVRRENEAKLFERGLATSHPEEHAKVANVPAVTDPDTVAHVQEQLRNLGYFHVGSADGVMGRKTEGAILAFRHDHGLPLSAVIDDDLLKALATAQPPEQSEERANATTDALREEKSQTIAFTDKVKALGGKLFGTGLSVSGAGGALGLLTTQANQISGARDAVNNLGVSQTTWILLGCGLAIMTVLAAVGLAFWYIADRIEQRRLYDYRIGKHP